MNKQQYNKNRETFRETLLDFTNVINKMFYNNKLKVKIILGYKNDNSTISGYYSPYYKQIYLNCFKLDVLKLYDYFLHELSHTIQFQYYKRTGKNYHDKFFDDLNNNLCEKWLCYVEQHTEELKE